MRLDAAGSFGVVSIVDGDWEGLDAHWTRTGE
jgi:hypothetical protein